MKRESQKNPNKYSRRDFIKIGATGIALAGTLGVSGCSGESIIPKKRLGKTDMNISILALGGGSTLSMIKNDDEAVALIDLARRKGVNFYDSAVEYGRGKSQKRFGQALEGHRKEVYFCSKYNPDTGPDKLMEDVEESLKSLRTNYIDVACFHGLASIEHAESMFATGTLEKLIQLKEQGVVRYLGVTGHWHPPALTHAIKRYDFDVVMMAANALNMPFYTEFEDAVDTSFEDMTIPVAVEKKMGIIAFKSLGQRRLLEGANEPKGEKYGHTTADVLMRYSLSLPVHGIIVGMHTIEHVESAAALVADYTPMTREEMKEWNRKLAPKANSAHMDYLRPDYVDNGEPRAHLA